MSWRSGKITRCPLKFVAILKNYLFVLFNFTAESVNCSLLENLEKTFLQYDLQKKNFVKHIENLPQHLSENLSAIIYRLQISL